MKLQVVMLDRNRTQVALKHENSFVPYGRRIVTVELTEEQCALLTPRVLADRDDSRPIVEEVGEVWLEDVLGGVRERKSCGCSDLCAG